MAKLPLSVIILTYNEEKNIEECLKSVYDWVDEIFIVDSGSTDKTLEIAKSYTDKIYQHPFKDYGKQRNWAQDNLPINKEWIFHLDADERVSSELSEELKGIFSRAVDGTDGFLVSRKTVFMGRWIKYGGHYPAYHLRIFRKDFGRCEDRIYDQHFYVNGKLKTLKEDIIDTVTSDLDNWVSRHNRWASLEAVETIQNKVYRRTHKNYKIKPDIKGNPVEKKRWLRRKYYTLPIFIRPFFYFIYRYFFRLGFLDGKEGLIFHFLQGFWFRFLVDAKIYEMGKKGKLN
ncbi:MAG: glycosyltransferase family 2 protein [Candidatus Omnitrophica bacterium]|nr:glycosyltransferase family 2 protein [Candidatus Omnitrophota bacterium]